MKKYMNYAAVMLAGVMALSGCTAESSQKVSEDTAETVEESVSSAVKHAEIVDNKSLQVQSFRELTQSGKIAWDPTEVDDSIADGILVHGENKVLADHRFTIDEDFDFGEYKLQRIMVTGLGQAGAKTVVNVYLDEAEEPAASIELPVQKEAGEWKQDHYANRNSIVSDLKITGSHKVEFSVCQYVNDEVQTEGECEVYLENIQFTAESIPLMVIEIDESLGTIEAMNSDEKHGTECYGNVSVLVAEGYEDENQSSYTGGEYTLEYIRGRGNSTWRDTKGKRPYKIKLDSEADLFGMGANKHWALLSNELDVTGMRNAVTYKIGEMLGMEYATGSAAVDVVMNGEYLGNYLLAENVRIDESRVDIDDLSEDQSNITGGYLLGTGEWGADEEEYIFTTSRGATINVAAPSSEDPEEFKDANAYIEEYVQRVENALYKESDEDLNDLMDLDSAVQYYWIQELSENGDFFGSSSTTLYKKRDGKLYWGPLWDFDIAWDNVFDSSLGMEYEGQWARRMLWFAELLTDDEFYNAAAGFYKETLEPLMEEILAEDGYFDQYYSRISYSAMNSHIANGYSTVSEDYSEELLIKDHDQILPLLESRLAGLKAGMLEKVRWCSNNLESLRMIPAEYIFMADGETVAEVHGYRDDAVMVTPEAPMSKDENLVFDDWYYQAEDVNGEREAYFEYFSAPEYAYTEKDGKSQVIIEAVYKEK